MVCLGNICRSPLAEGILRNKISNMNVTVDWAGTAGYHIGSKPDPRAIDIAKKNSIDISSLRARKFERSDFINFDKIYVMDKNNYYDIIDLAENKDHATVLHACKTVNNLADTDKRFKGYISDIEKRLTIS